MAQQRLKLKTVVHSIIQSLKQMESLCLNVVKQQKETCSRWLQYTILHIPEKTINLILYFSYILCAPKNPTETLCTNLHKNDQ